MAFFISILIPTVQAWPGIQRPPIPACLSWQIIALVTKHRMSKPRRPKSIPNMNDPFEPSKATPQRQITPSLFDDDLTLEEEDMETLKSAPKPTPEPEPEESQESPAAPVASLEATGLGGDKKDSVDEGESVPRRRNRREEAALPSVQRPANQTLDRIGRLAALILVPLLFVAVFFTILKKRPIAEQSAAKVGPSLPISGKLVQISQATTGWRDRTESDRVSPEMQLLTRATVYPSQLPELQLKLTPSSPNAFLRVLFIDSDGEIAGDPKIIKVLDGKIQPTGTSGDKIINDTECAVAASTGLQTDRHLEDYLRSSRSRWSVKISESNNYQAKDDDWKLLDTFAIADNRL